MASIVSAVFFVLWSQSSAPAAPPASTCAVAEDPTYGYTTENPVQVGGGAMYVKAREQRYLDALRGPGGQSIQYKRIGSVPQSPNSRTILDRYEVTYGGLEQPMTLYLDAYHFWTPRAPKGLIC